MDAETLVGDLTKGGVNIVTVNLRRNMKGLSLFIKAIPEVEEFWKAIAPEDSEYADVRTQGRYWSIPEGADPLQVMPLPTGNRIYGQGWRIDKPGTPLGLIADDGAGYARNSVNLAFLRLRGISQPQGVTFSVVGVYSTDGVAELHRGIMQGVKEFYVGYLKPIDFIVNVVGQQVAMPISTVQG